MHEQCLCDGVGKTADQFQSYHQEGGTFLMLSVVMPCLEGQFRRFLVSTLLRCVRKGSHQGTVEEMHRSGSPKATTAVDDRYLGISARRNPESNATMLNNAFLAATGYLVLTQTVGNRLHGVQLHSRRPW